MEKIQHCYTSWVGTWNLHISACQYLMVNSPFIQAVTIYGILGQYNFSKLFYSCSVYKHFLSLNPLQYRIVIIFFGLCVLLFQYYLCNYVYVICKVFSFPTNQTNYVISLHSYVASNVKSLCTMTVIRVFIRVFHDINVLYVLFIVAVVVTFVHCNIE